MATPQDLLSALANAYSLTEGSSAEDPGFAGALEQVRKIQDELGWLVVQVSEDGFRVQDEVLEGMSQTLAAFGEDLLTAGVSELRFRGGVDDGLVAEFLQQLRLFPDEEGALGASRFRSLSGALEVSFKPGFGRLPGMAGGIQNLFFNQTSRPVSPEPPSDITAVVDGEPWNEDELRRLAQSLAGRRDFVGLSELVEGLVGSVEDDARGYSAMSLAQEFTTPAVASAMVARLAASGNEEDRARMVGVISRIGMEGPLALTDALEQARDRSERRILLGAMVALGHRGVEMAERMVADPRWYVVRNGVSILGEVGGERVVKFLTATLASEDSRVRRESIRALAKVGGNDAESLILGMLEDGEPPVRAAACRALGVLGSQRAVRHLVELLDDSDDEVQLDCIQALGHIGDPGPVQFIEKKARGGILSRPPREVRITAFRALAAIGTPRALKTLEKGLRDGDDAVRNSVEALLEPY
jgi:hypothetical protein